MPSYKAPVEEVLFLLRDVFPIQRYNNLPGFAEATSDVVEAIVAEAAKLCEQTLQPLNQTGDREGCVRNKDGSVATPHGFKEAYRATAAKGSPTHSPRSSMSSRVPRTWRSPCTLA
jgi:acyl-CoA dehydrogenase